MTNAQSQNLIDLSKSLPAEMFGRVEVRQALIDAAKTIHEQKMILDTLYNLKYTSAEIIRTDYFGVRIGIELPMSGNPIVNKYRFPKNQELFACGHLQDIVIWDDNVWNYKTLET